MPDLLNFKSSEKVNGPNVGELLKMQVGSNGSTRPEHKSANVAMGLPTKALARREASNLAEQAMIAGRVTKATSQNPRWSYQTTSRQGLRGPTTGKVLANCSGTT